MAEQVTWLEEMTQIEIIEQYKLADIVFEQMGKSVVGMGGLDAMAVGRPIIANGRPEFFTKVWGELAPICQASTPIEVYLQLKKLVLDIEARNIIGRNSRLFAEKHFSGKNACKIVLSKIYEHFAASYMNMAAEFQRMKLDLECKRHYPEIFLQLHYMYCIAEHSQIKSAHLCNNRHCKFQTMPD